MTHHYDSSASGYISDSFEGEPLYLDNLRKGDGSSSAETIAYVCGKKTGVNFEHL